MNNEIKEILQTLGGIASGDWIQMLPKEANKLLDYITNLQERIDQYENPDDMTLFYMWIDEKAKDKMKQLEEENKRLNNIINETLEYAKYQLENLDFYKDTKARMLCSMGIVLLQGEDNKWQKKWLKN